MSVQRPEVLLGDLGRRRWPGEVNARFVGESLEPNTVVAEAGPDHAAPPTPASPARVDIIEIEFGGTILRAGAGIDCRQLMRILRASKAAEYFWQVGDSRSSSPPCRSTSARTSTDSRR